MVKMKVFMMFFAMILILAGIPASVQAQTETGLVGEWHFDGDAKDSSGNGNDGTVYGATFVEGKFGKALSFDGVNDYFDYGTSNDFNYGVGSSFTYDFWINTMENEGVLISQRYSTNGAPALLIAIGFAGWSNFGSGEIGILLRADNGNMAGCYSGCTELDSNSVVNDGKFHNIVVVRDVAEDGIKIYIDGLLKANVIDGLISGINTNLRVLASERSWIADNLATSDQRFFKGIIDEVRIYNLALSSEEIKEHYEKRQTALTVKKEVTPYSIRQYQTTNVTVQIKNTGTSEIRDIEIVDSTNSNLELIGGEFPNPKKYNSLSSGESREIRYFLKSKESGTFILNSATVSYTDSTGNIKVVKSEPVSLTVVPSSEGSPEISSPSDIGTSSAVLLHGEKTDVVLGEDILLKLSAVNLITKPPMSVQVMIYPPSGMSVTGSEFVKSGAGIYTTTYTLNPGDGKDIEVHIKSNQVGDFNVKGRIVYYFGEEKEKAEDHTLNLPIKVRKEAGQTVPSSTDDAGLTAKTPGFAGEFAIIGILFVALLLKRRG